MNKIKINSKRILFQREYELKRYFIPKNTGLIQYYFMDDAEDELAIKVFTKLEFQQIMEIMDVDEGGITLELLNEYNYIMGQPNYENTFEIEENEKNDYLKIILGLIKFCQQNSILLIQPNDANLNISKSIVWQRIQEDVNWWKDDLVFRKFSKS